MDEQANELMSVGHSWIDTDKEKPQDPQKNLLQCHFVHLTSSMDCPRIDPGPSYGQVLQREEQARCILFDGENISFDASLVIYMGRFHPFTGHEGPQGEQRYSSTLFQTSALEGGEGSASRLGSTLPPGKTRYPLYRRLGGPHGRSGQVRKISPHRDSIPGPSSTQAVAIPTTLPGPRYIYKQY